MITIILDYKRNDHAILLISFLFYYKMLRFAFRRNFSVSKVVESAEEAVKGLKDGSTVMIGGFGICGIAMHLINAVSKTGAQNLRIVSNTAGIDNWGTGVLLRTPGMVKRMMASYIG